MLFNANKHSMAFDGKHIYAIIQDIGLVKICTSENPFQINSGIKIVPMNYDDDSIAVLGDKIYLRS